MKKSLGILFLALAILLLASPALAEDYSVSLHTINAQVSADGSASVIEKFFISFPTPQDKVDFRQKSEDLGLDGDAWTTFNPLFKPSLGNSNIANGKILYNEANQSYLEISYNLTDPLMAQGKETTLMIEYNIKAPFFNNLYQSGFWVIPDNTSLTVELPPGAEVKDTVEPQATITTSGPRKLVTWDGYKSSNKLALSYVLWKKMNPVIDLSSITNFLFKTQEGIALIIIVAVILAVILIKRKKITGKIESFVENNSIMDED